MSDEPSTKHLAVTSPAEFGAIIRAVRKAQGLRQDELPGVSHRFLIEVERGKPTVQLGKVLDVLRELGVRVTVDLPPGVTVTFPAEGGS